MVSCHAGNPLHRLKVSDNNVKGATYLCFVIGMEWQVFPKHNAERVGPECAVGSSRRREML